MGDTEPSIVEYRGGRVGYRCGYCGSSSSKVSNGMWAHRLTVQDYQDLIDRGWRRSGKYTYKPTMTETCCPQYAIRCDVLDFKLSRSQKKTIKRVNRYLSTGVKPGCCSSGGSQADIGASTSQGDGDEFLDLGSEPRHATNFISRMSNVTGSVCDATKVETPRLVSSAEQNTTKVETPPRLSSAEQNLPKLDSSSMCKHSPEEADGVQLAKRTPKEGLGADPNKPLCKKAKLRRREKRQQKETSQKPQRQKQKKAHSEPKSLEEYLNDISENPAHRLEIKLVRSAPRSDNFVEKYDEAYMVYQQYQMTIHNDEPCDCTTSGYKRFLVDSPLKEEKHEEGFPDGFGSFHQQYILNGQIIAVGVVDILPQCVSSVYFYYDPDYAFLSLGSYSALREIAFTRQLHTMEPNIKYYYMGYYIHSCPKMKYKGQYHSSHLLCPETYLWYPIERCRPLLDANKYSRFAEPDKVDADKDIRTDDVLVLHSHQAMPYVIYRALNTDAEDSEEVEEYAGFVGRKCATRMLLYRS